MKLLKSEVLKHIHGAPPMCSVTCIYNAVKLVAQRAEYLLSQYTRRPTIQPMTDIRPRGLVVQTMSLLTAHTQCTVGRLLCYHEQR